MSEKQVVGEGMPSSLAGMSKSQLYEIMSQMKALIEQNKQQARQILIQNPVLTRSLFQAQIMLGMVQSPQLSTSISSAPSQIPNPQPLPMSTQQPLKPSHVPNHPTSFPGLTGQTQMRKQQPPNQAAMVNPHSQPIPPNPQSQPNISRGSLHPLQQPNAQSAQISTAQSSQVPNIIQLPQHSISQRQPSLHQPSMPSMLTQSQQPMQNSGNQYMPLQPPQSQQLRPQMPGFPHQGHSQMGPNMGFQHPSGPQIHHSQHMFHSGANNLGGMGPGTSFQQGQVPHPNQPMPPSLYQGGNPRMGMDFNQTGNSRQADRGGPNWAPALQENTTGQLTGQPSFPSQLGASNQPPRPTALAPELETQLLQQVMSLTPEQINQLPPEQRNQVLQLQQMLRQ